MAIDTLEVAKELKAAGFSEGQAEAVARVVSRAQAETFASVATKADLRETELRLEGKIVESRAGLEGKLAEARSGLEGKLAEAKTDLLKWVIGSIGVQTIVIVGAIIALARALGG